MLPLLNFLKLIVKPLLTALASDKSARNDCAHTAFYRGASRITGEEVHIAKGRTAALHHFRTGKKRTPIRLLTVKTVLLGHNAVEKPFHKGKVVRRVAKRGHIHVRVRVDKRRDRQAVFTVDHLVRNEIAANGADFGNDPVGDRNILNGRLVALGKKNVFDKKIHKNLRK